MDHRSSSLSSNWSGLLPRQETGALDFIRSNASFDGRGIIVGILDSGVDPGAPGLQVTSTGLPKVIDVIDCSGSGDVRMGPPVSPDSDGLTIAGVTGRILKLNPSWINPTNKYRVGMKRVYELYTSPLKSRISAERSLKWSSEIKDLENKLHKEILTAGSNSELVDDLKVRILQLRLILEKDFEDPGPLYDCVVFHDGAKWCAAIDSTETGDFATIEPMCDFRINKQYKMFSNSDSLNYSVNIYDSGDILSIVCDCSPHGTHVAGIVSAYHPDQIECNGVAPGAQIVSLKIGDHRLGSMETGVGLIRALIEAVKRGCHVINMSYGEATSWDDYGEFCRLANQLVYKHGIIFVASAGNNGPACSTVGCPGGTTSAIMGIGALFAESSMASSYSMLNSIEPTNYSWSSVGPSVDGSMGVSVLAPGGAVTCVPTWTLSKKKLMNGTSMSSPNACGCIALLLSAAQQENISTTPVRVRRAIENSAMILKEVNVLGQGHGLIRVPEAFALLAKFNFNATQQLLCGGGGGGDASASVVKRACWFDVPFSIGVLSNENMTRGIYLRQPFDTNVISTFKIDVKPLFQKHTATEFQYNFDVRVVTECSADWIRTGRQIAMLADGKVINVAVDPTKLVPGKLYVEFVRLFDEDNYELGPILTIPVTVMKPETLPPSAIDVSSPESVWNLGKVSLRPGQRYRRFFTPPSGCQYIDVIVRDLRVDQSSSSSNYSNSDGKETEVSVLNRSVQNLTFHALQVFRGVPYRDNEKDGNIALLPNSQHCFSFSVFDNWTVDFTLAPNFATVLNIDCEVEMIFRGLEPVPRTLHMTGGQRVSEPVKLFARLSDTDVNPSAKLDRCLTAVKPTAPGQVLPLGERDVLPDGTPFYQMQVEYSVDFDESCDIIPRWRGLQNVLYESDFHAQLFMVLDSSKKVIGVGDAFPSFMKIPKKGVHTIRLQIRHSSPKVLEGLVEIPVIIERKIKEISMNFHQLQSNALIGKDKVNTKTLTKGQAISIYCKEPESSQIPKFCSPGDVLIGQANYGNKVYNKLGAGTNPGGYMTRYIINDSHSKGAAHVPKDGPSTAAAASSSSKSKSFEDTIKEAKLKYLNQIVGKSDTFNPLFEVLSSEYPDEIAIKLSLLSHLVSLKSQISSTSLQAYLTASVDIIKAADSIIKSIDTDRVLISLGKVSVDKSDAVATEAKSWADKSKSTLIDTHSTILHELVSLIKIAEENDKSIPNFSIRSLFVGAEADGASSSSSAGGGGDGSSSSSSSDDISNPASSTDINALIELLSKRVKHLEAWDSVDSDKYVKVMFTLWKSKNLFGKILKKTNDIIDSGKFKDVKKEYLLETKINCLNQLGWKLLLQEEEKWAVISKANFPLF